VPEPVSSDLEDDSIIVVEPIASKSWMDYCLVIEDQGQEKGGREDVGEEGEGGGELLYCQFYCQDCEESGSFVRLRLCNSKHVYVGSVCTCV